MSQLPIDQGSLKETMKAAFAEALHEQREYLHEVFLEVLEDYALSAAIREGLETEPVSRSEIFRVLKGKR